MNTSFIFNSRRKYFKRNRFGFKRNFWRGHDFCSLKDISRSSTFLNDIFGIIPFFVYFLIEYFKMRTIILIKINQSQFRKKINFYKKSKHFLIILDMQILQVFKRIFSIDACFKVFKYGKYCILNFISIYCRLCSFYTLFYIFIFI